MTRTQLSCHLGVYFTTVSAAVPPLVKLAYPFDDRQTDNNLQILRARGGKEIDGVRSLNLIQYFTVKNDGNNN